MKKTENFNLNQWEPTDPIRREDFNADNAALDAALAGVLKLETGSYKGAGAYGESNPNILTFSFPPKVVGVVADSSEYSMSGALFVAGQNKSSGIGTVSNSGAALALVLTWSGNSLSWYSEDDNASASRQLNSGTVTYHYFAIG